MNVDLIGLYDKILDAQGIQFQLFTQALDNIEKSDYGFRKKIYKDYDYNDFFHNILKNADSAPLFFFRDDFQLNYCFLELPELIREEYQARYALIGPVIFRFMTNTALEQVMQSHQFPVAFTKELLEFYNRIPTLPSYDFWVSLLMPLLRPLYGTTKEYQFVDIASSMKPKPLDNEMKVHIPNESPSFDAIAARYEAEDQIINAVVAGNADEAVEKYHKFRQFNLSPRTPDILRNQKNWLIILNTNLRRAVRRAQVHPYYIDELSREFAIKIETTNSMSQLDNMSSTMLRKYAMLSHNYSTKEYSPLVKKCIDYIRFYYQEPLSLEILADHCSITPSYLSIQFHKETDMTVTEYIHNIRIRHAILLLNSTQYSIQEIAGLCGFPDSNYFTRTFKKLKGITPNAYRKSIK